MKTLIRFCRGMLGIALVTVGVATVANAQPGRYGNHDYGRGGFAGPAHIAAPPVYSRGYVGAYHNNFYPGGLRPAFAPPAVVYRGGYSPFYGPRYVGVPHGSISITFGGNPYFYFGGAFYRPYGGYYRTVFPPVGLQIGFLPPGYSSFYVGPDPYYFYNGIYYRPYGDGGYEVTDAPMGATLHFLPQGAKSVLVNGEKFYELNGTYYKEDRDANGNTIYTVVGKNGEINNTETAGNNDETEPAAPAVGDTVSELPANTRTITLNGETLYVSPDDTYYRKEADNAYTIVGIAGSVNTSAGNGGQSL